MSTLESFLQNRLDNLHKKNQFRHLRTNHHLVDFSSNDYLGLARNEVLNQNIQHLWSNLKFNHIGSGGSRLITGHHPLIDEIESYIAKTHHSESALIFNSGYNANLSVFSSIPQKGDLILYDELCHASIKDGIRLSLAEKFPFKHNSLEGLIKKVENLKSQYKNIYVGVESIYSMDGDIAPLKELADICYQRGFILIVDEAHSGGIYGKGGAGLISHLGLNELIPIRIFTYGKAFGVHGACVVGSELLKSYLINFARPFIYTTALPLHSYVQIYGSYLFLDKYHIELQQNLMDNIKILNMPSSLESNDPISSPIVCVQYPGNENAKSVAKNLQDSGYDIRAILSPTVPVGKERIRICIHNYNRPSDLIGLASKLK